MPELKDKRGSAGARDPGRIGWVWAVYLLLLLAALPVWPLPGMIWGLPAWAVTTVAVAAVTSAFTVFVLLKVWDEAEEDLDESC
ncbi:MAG: hypothetical protein G3M78_05100 [Candidatus Nitrohelix vancouverensis]|uniref:DUF3311 domain-containing protein n=1 Tax=Candidatus Nitrohelix vancouverensis TaxID=2705534 RepID=A0A7T0C1J1_9BACT|nr:MAG: hypothetical protein G3M78_05100 [Candidatus Nitrohelix vancouverensis]